MIKSVKIWEAAKLVRKKGIKTSSSKKLISTQRKFSGMRCKTCCHLTNILNKGVRTVKRVFMAFFIAIWSPFAVSSIATSEQSICFND